MEDLMDDLTWVLTAKGSTEQWGRNAHGHRVQEAQRRGATLLLLHTLENCSCLVLSTLNLDLGFQRPAHTRSAVNIFSGCYVLDVTPLSCRIEL